MITTTAPLMSRLIAEGQEIVRVATDVASDIELLLPQHEYVQPLRRSADPAAMDPAAMKARINYRPVLGVTDILRGVGLIEDRWWAEEHATRGTQIHALAHATLNLGLEAVAAGPFESWGPYFGYGTSLYRWLDEKRPTTLAAEWRVYHPIADYAGTLDWFGIVNDALWVLDIKTRAEASWHALQTAGYVGALSAPVHALAPIRRGALYLHHDGQPATLRVHYKPSDRGIFQAALAVERFKRRSS